MEEDGLPSMLPDDLDALIDEALTGDGIYTFDGCWYDGHGEADGGIGARDRAAVGPAGP